MMCMPDYEVQSSMTNFNVGIFFFFKKNFYVRNKFLSDQDLKLKFCVVIV